jgi:GTP diphosphokinase / guanosine-3',5'-bis(diphosphate) 3'-diphosphatase
MTQEYDFLRCDHDLYDTTEYLREVIRKKYTEADVSHVFEAFTLAEYAHRGQYRADGLPFIIHPMRVALMLVHFDRNITSKMFIAALLHDTLEDTDLYESVIEEKFGKYVAKLVRSVTIRYETQDFRDKQAAKLQKWRELMLSSHEARTIKIFEDLDNMIYWKTIPVGCPEYKKIPRWLEETQKTSLPLAYATNTEAYLLMQKEYEYYVECGFTSQPISL